jgi:hypothetical protein
LATVAFMLFTTHHGFPFFYHPDEVSKIDQILKHERNWKHPQLLLTASEIGVLLARPGESKQAVVEVGRTASALFGAAAVAALTWLGFYQRGMLGGLAGGTVSLLAVPLLIAAHYMKEDAALIMGLAVFLVAAWRYRHWPSAGTQIALGMACALAVAGKYPGGLTLVMVAPLLWGRPVRETAEPRMARVGRFLVAFAITSLILNYTVFQYWDTVFKGVGYELKHLVTDHHGLKTEGTLQLYGRVLLREITPLMRGLLIVHLLYMAGTFRRRTAVEWIVTTLPFGYGLLLCGFPIANERYFMPVVVMLSYLAGLGVVDLAELLVPCRMPGGAWLRGAVILAGLAGVAVSVWPRYEACLNEFASDPRRELAVWVAANLPRDAVIAQDTAVYVQGADGLRGGDVWPSPRRVKQSRWVADLGTVDELRRQGVTHVAVAGSFYARFFDAGVAPSARGRADYLRRRGFYQELFETGEPIWRRAGGMSDVLTPELRLYALPR